MKKTIPVLLCFALLISMFVGCTGGQTEQTSSLSSTAGGQTSTAAGGSAAASNEDLPWLTYTFLDVRNTIQPDGESSKDAVTPYLEEKFRIKMDYVTFGEGQGAKERLNMMIAAGNLADVILVPNPDLPWLVSMDVLMPLDDYVDRIPTMRKWVNELGWKMMTFDDKLYGLPNYGQPNLEDPEIAAIIADSDKFYYPPSSGSLKVNEKILEQAGYKFKTLAEIQAQCEKEGRRPTWDDLALDPPIETFDDFEKLLYTIRDNVKTDAGLPVIPLSINDWAILHIQNLFAPSSQWWRNPETNEVTGYVNHPWAKDVYRDLVTWVQDGILDPDYLVQKQEQMQEKYASGRAAVLYSVPNMMACRDAVRTANPGYDFRPLRWPTTKYGETVNYSNHAVDGVYPCGFGNMVINKDFKETERLLDYFEYLWSEEFLDIITWGPESAGLYEVVDGKKQFLDEDLFQSVRTGTKTPDGRAASTYGIYDCINYYSYSARALLGAPMHPFNYKNMLGNYPVQVDAYTNLTKLVGSEGVVTDGSVLSSGYDELTTTPTNWFAYDFRSKAIAELIATKSDAEFDAVWDKWVADFEVNGKYSEALPYMEQRYASLLD
ncbi:extracellular solute-binding protein [Ruminococcaceae bacterium OttesenSCG-928-L11]|nr:extracellular solute-binding protein [Ruminococcaceae bacterium OttesenSCG-928-L11]